MSGGRNMRKVYYVYNTLSYTYVQLLVSATTSNFSMHIYRLFKSGNVGVKPFLGGLRPAGWRPDIFSPSLLLSHTTSRVLLRFPPWF
jgi:hypothetical protein